MKILIIVPCFNEEESIEEVVGNIERYIKNQGISIDFLIINDSSTDSTQKIIDKYGWHHLRLANNLGIGGAVQAGLIYALEKDYSFVVQMDGDGQHIPEEIEKLINVHQSSGAHLVIGSRFRDLVSHRTTIWRRIGIAFISFLLRLLFGARVKDCTSGFRLFDRKAMELAVLYYPDEYPEPGSIAYFTRMGLKIKEVGVRMNERSAGTSSIRGLKTIYYMVKVFLSLLSIKLASPTEILKKI
ncbi:MAG: glycosyltransferase family 2 protein [Flavobacteriales bacterium]|nr:glycosyltransferase family 2 protein [Flavobacteriales bacterium]